MDTSLAHALSERYVIERELGTGGMATVWLAQDLKHDRRVALKVLHPQLTAMLGAERFLKGIRTIENHDWALFMMRQERPFAPYHAEPEFQELERRVGLM